jgi:hypothetical protein
MECPICKQGFDEEQKMGVALPCTGMHSFHFACLHSWWTRVGPKCCFCRDEQLDLTKINTQYFYYMLDEVPLEKRLMPQPQRLSRIQQDALLSNSIQLIDNSVDDDGEGNLSFLWLSHEHWSNKARTWLFRDLVGYPACLPLMARLMMKCTPRDRLVVGTFLKTLPEQILDTLFDLCNYGQKIQEHPDNLAMIVREEILVGVTVRNGSGKRVHVTRCEPVGVVPYNFEVHGMELIVWDASLKARFLRLRPDPHLRAVQSGAAVQVAEEEWEDAPVEVEGQTESQ